LGSYNPPLVILKTIKLPFLFCSLEDVVVEFAESFEISSEAISAPSFWRLYVPTIKYSPLAHVLEEGGQNSMQQGDKSNVILVSNDTFLLQGEALSSFAIARCSCSQCLCSKFNVQNTILRMCFEILLEERMFVP
jgi:hypothetical protein